MTTELIEIKSDIKNLAKHMLTIAKAVYDENGYSDEEDLGDILPDEGAPVEDPIDKGMYKNEGEGYEDNGDDMMPYDNEDEDAYMMRAMKKFKAVRKGFADTGTVASNEEDAKFDEKDSNVEGNEASPAGDQGGEREDETFGPGGMSYGASGSAGTKSVASDLKALNGMVTKLAGVVGKGKVIAKSNVPGVSKGAGARNGNLENGSVTREMQEAAKGRSFKELNALRTQVGDLPAQLF